MAVKYQCIYCRGDIINFDCSCIEAREQTDMWNRDQRKIKLQEVKQ